MQERKNIVFLSSSFVNLSKLLAINNKEFDIFLVLDRKFPLEFEDLDNFYSFIFANQKLYDKDKEKYFDNLGVFIEEFKPDIIITNNFTKLLPKSFVDFMKFRNSKLEIFNLHHADIRHNENFKGLNADIKQFLEEEQIITTIHKIENEKMDEGKQLAHSYPTTLKELKQKNLIHKKEDILNLRLRNVILSYHERTKVLNLLKKIINQITIS